MTLLPDTRFEIQALAVCGQALYPSVTDAPHDKSRPAMKAYITDSDYLIILNLTG